VEPALHAVGGAAGEERAAVAGLDGERTVGEAEGTIGEGEHFSLEGPARRILLEPPLEGEGLEVGEHGVVRMRGSEGGEPGLGRVEVAVVDEVEGGASLGVVGPPRIGRPRRVRRAREGEGREEETAGREEIPHGAPLGAVVGAEPRPGGVALSPEGHEPGEELRVG